MIAPLLPTVPRQPSGSATIAMSRFRVVNGMSEQVAEAFAKRPHLVDHVAGFLGLETFTDRQDSDIFYLVTRWTNAEAFRAWHDSPAHHASHRFMPKGLKLDPAYTMVSVMDRIEASDVDAEEAVVHDAALLVSDFLRHSTTTVVASATADGVVLSCNEALLSLLGETREFLVGKSLWDYVVEGDSGDLRALLAASTRRSRAFSLRLRGPSTERALRCHVDVHPGHFVLIGEPDLTVDAPVAQRLFEMNSELAVASRELTRKTRELEAAKRLIEEQARHDALTGLFNRRHLFDSMKIEIERAQRGLSSVSLIMLDLDHFKTVNDTFGHVVGDAVLQSTAAMLMKALRPYDLPARYGGEELVVLLPGTTLQTAAVVAERLRAGLEKNVVPGYPHPVTASFGVAEWEEGDTRESWIGRADAALYEGKKGGRNRVTVAPSSKGPRVAA